ncbi:hypothetical protein J0871_16950 [Salegentibacter sp. BDJ18]|uniref:hypothetical protein n=1 Tax=Salegentibacter sp. BDJ18 TaxID=2816376 RepID=UPI001AAE6C12|nr:hypothetical protein [Salegentibacter sp. BDJ18]MBO2546107.1 hypothetical protein [Salegentibacter sp. BDJ18]
MTPEGKEFIDRMYKENGKIKSILGYDLSDGFSFMQVELIRSGLSQAEIEEAEFHIANGCKEIVVSDKGPNRLNGFGYQDIFRDGLQGLSRNHLKMFIDNMYKSSEEKVSDHCADALSYSLEITGNKKVQFVFDIEKQLEAELSWCDHPEDRLREKLREEEARENYEMCAEILKYAESKGINL